jgi:hypothetical protein
MWDRVTTVIAALSAIALVAGVVWAAAPSASLIIVNEHVIDVSDAGRVVVAQSGLELEIVEVEVNPGWTHEVGIARGRVVAASFGSVDRQIEFDADFADNEILVTIRGRVGSTDADPETPVGETPATTTADPSPTTTAGSSSGTVDGG